MAMQTLIQWGIRRVSVPVCVGSLSFALAAAGALAQAPANPSVATNGSQDVAAKGSDARADPKSPPAPEVALESLHFKVACVQLVETSRFPSLHRVALLETPATQPALSCPTDGPTTLVGKGQVIVLVDAGEYDRAIAASAARSSKASEGPELVLNGFHLGMGARLLAVERSDVEKVDGSLSHYVALRYQLVPNDDSEDAWTTLYQEVGLVKTSELRVALAWKNVTVFAADHAGKPHQIAISDWWSLIPAFGICALVLAFYWWSMYRTDLFRTSSAFAWWQEAQRLRTQVMKALSGNTDWATHGFEPTKKTSFENAIPEQVAPALVSGGVALAGIVPAAPIGLPAPVDGVPRVDPAAGTAIFHKGLTRVDAQDKLALCPAVLELLRNSAYGGPNFTSKEAVACMDRATLALNEHFPKNPYEVSQTIIGLSLHRRSIPVARATFSLVAVQVGTWVTFACLAAIFLWLVFGQWPMLKGSMLILVTISAATATASWLVDSSSKGFTPSVSLLRDLTAGTDKEQRVHRFQAVMVNVLLLFIGTAFVVQHLAYPTFDASWLEFLGLSGLVQAAGKGLLEKRAKA